MRGTTGTSGSARRIADAVADPQWIARAERARRLQQVRTLSRVDAAHSSADGNFWPGADFHSIATDAATASGYHRPRPARATALQRERSVDGGRRVRGLEFNAVIQLPHPIAVPTPGIQGVADIAQVGTSVAAMESDRTKPITR